MAQLMWKDVDAPRFDLNGLNQAAAGIGASFDRLGQMLINKEQQNRSQATDAAIAEAMALQDPEQVKARLAQGTAGLGGRVNAREFMTALGQYQNQLMETAKNREEMLNLQAVGELGDEGQHFVSLMGEGKRDEALKYASEQAANNPLWGRVAYQFGKDAEGVFDNWDTRRMAGERDAESKRHNIAGEGIDRSRMQMDGARLAMERKRFEQDQADRNAQKAAFGAGAQFASTVDPKYSAADARVLLTRTPEWRAGNPLVRAQLEAGLESTYGARTAALESELTAGGQSSGGMPSYLLPRGTPQTPSIEDMAASITGLKAQAATAQAARSQSFLASNPNLDVFKRVEAYKEKGVTFDDLVSKFESVSDIHNPKEDLLAVQRRENLSNEELAALIDVFGYKDENWLSLATRGGRTAGTRQFYETAAAYKKARDSGDVVKTQNQLGTALAPFEVTQKKLDSALARATRERAVSGAPSAEIQQTINNLREQLRALSAVGPGQ